MPWTQSLLRFSWPPRLQIYMMEKRGETKELQRVEGPICFYALLSLQPSIVQYLPRRTAKQNESAMSISLLRAEATNCAAACIDSAKLRGVVLP